MIIPRARGRCVADWRQQDVRDWATRTHPDVIPIGEAVRGEIATVAGLIEKVRLAPRDGRMTAVIRDATGELVASWRPTERLPPLLPGRGALVRGRLRRTPQPEMLNPRIILAPKEEPADGL